MRLTVLLFTLLGTLMLASTPTHGGLRGEGWYEPDIEFLRVAHSEGVTLKQAMMSDQWQSLDVANANFGYIRDTVWLRLSVPAHSGRQLLEVRYPHLDRINFFLIKDGVQEKEITTGDHFPFSQRPIKHRNFLFPVTAGSGSYQILLEIDTLGAMQIPLRIWEPTAFFEQNSTMDQLHSLYYGILITVIFFNLFVFLALRETTYLLYVLSTCGYLALLSNLNGTSFQMIWPESPWLQNQAMLMTVPIAMIFALLFSRAFLKLNQTSPVMDRLVRYTIILNLAVVMATFIVDYSIASRISVALAIPSCLLLTIIGPLQWAKGNPQASYYTIAWGLVTVGSALTAAHKYGLLPNHFITFYGMEIGSALEAILLTIALAARLDQERQEKVHAREAEIRAMEARRKAELKMMEQALHNPLTGLPNRISFEMLINDLINREPSRRYAIAIIRLNNLEAITKTLGHRNADRLLELASRRYNSLGKRIPGIFPVESSGLRHFYAASLESTTFGFVVDADTVSKDPRIIVQCMDQLREPIDFLGMQLPLDPQIGIAIYPDHAKDSTALIRRAYIAQETQEARDRGLAYYKPARDSYSADRLTLVSEFREALHNNRLELYFQPKLNLRTRAITGLETLIRWPARKNSIPVDELIAMTEQTGLIKPLTRWVLEQSLIARARLVAAGHDVALSVNISPNNLREPEFPQFVQQLLRKHPEHRSRIILEVTETSMMLDPINSLKALRQLNSTGIPLSIDDFGSGYSSLSYIKQLPAQEIKIDRSLITDLATEAEDRVIVQTTIDMCHSLGYQVVAEGVEEQSTLELLERMDCDMIQGYILTRPLPLEDIMKWLDARSEVAPRITG